MPKQNREMDRGYRVRGELVRSSTSFLMLLNRNIRGSEHVPGPPRQRAAAAAMRISQSREIERALSFATSNSVERGTTTRGAVPKEQGGLCRGGESARREY